MDARIDSSSCLRFSSTCAWCTAIARASSALRGPCLLPPPPPVARPIASGSGSGGGGGGSGVPAWTWVPVGFLRMDLGAAVPRPPAVACGLGVLLSLLDILLY